MKYLLYKIGDDEKRFALDAPVIRVGRDKSNQLVLADAFISRKHLSITVGSDSILVEDVGSENGFLVNNQLTRMALIQIGETFRVGEIDFYLSNDDVSEIDLSETVQTTVSDLNVIQMMKHKDHHPERSLSLGSVIMDIELELMSAAVKYGSFDDFVVAFEKKLKRIPNIGMFIFVRSDEPLRIYFSLNDDGSGMTFLKRMVEKGSDLLNPSADLNSDPYKIYPLNLEKKGAFFIYFPNQADSRNEKIIEQFLKSLANKCSNLYRIFNDIESRNGSGDQKRISEADIITINPQMKALVQQAKRMAASDIFLLIQGESGTGKDLFARLIHHYSNRRHKELVFITCAAIPEAVLDRELFGIEEIEPGSKSKHSIQMGKLELASGGTLVLDEIGDLPMATQAKLLRILESRQLYRVGGNVPVSLDLRIISMSHQKMVTLIEEKKFREDLYYRLVHRSLRIPPLRERKDDIPTLINYFSDKYADSIRKKIDGFSVQAIDALVNFNWKGNVRQLENEIYSILNLVEEDGRVGFELLSESIRNRYYADEKEDDENTAELDDSYETIAFNKKPNKDEIIQVLNACDWNKTKAAARLNMTYHGLHKKMKKLNIINRSQISKENDESVKTQ